MSQMKSLRFSKETIQQLGYYVYLYSDPDGGKVFYIGKGQGNRCFDHLLLAEKETNDKASKIQDLLKAGKEPRIEILRWGLSEEEALAVEQATIDLLGLHQLTNQQRGRHSATQGRISAEVLERRLSAKAVTPRQVEELKARGVLLIRLSKYRPDMSEGELYDLTRCAWRLNADRKDLIHYVFAVVDGKIIETYHVAQWLPGHSTWNSLNGNGEEYREMESERGRFEFVGLIDRELHERYADLDVSDLFTKGQQNPLKYLIEE